jgi:hypothetical protein
MSDQSKESEVGRAIWQSQALEVPRLSIEYVRHQAEKLNADLRRESRMGYSAMVLCALSVVYVLWKSLAMQGGLAVVLRVAVVLLVCGASYVVAQIPRRSRMLGVRDAFVMQSLDQYRHELQRRRDLYWTSRQWSVWPLVPGAILVFVGGLIYDERPNKLLRYTFVAIFAVGWTALALWHYKRKGDSFQRELEALDSMKSDTPARS